MASSRLLVVLLLATVLLHQVACTKQPQSAFLWSNLDLFSTDYTNDQFPASDLSYLMDSIMGIQQKYAGLLKENTQVSNLVLFIAPSGSTPQQSSTLKSFVEASESSMAIPYSYLSTISVSGVYSDVIVATGYSQIDNLLKDEIAENKIVVLDLSDEDISTSDDVLTRTVNTFESRKYAMMYSSKSVDAPSSSLLYSARAYLSVKEEDGDDQLCTGEYPNQRCLGPPYHSYWPPYIVEGLATSFLLIFVTVIGIYCTAQLQTPTQFETKEKRKDTSLT